jgi:dipeptidyl aminopeptidase/acylaminoacyl peptidase
VSPDGRRVAYTAGLAAVRVATINDPSSDHVVADRRDFVIDPSWSPDGSTLAWHAWDVPNIAWDLSVFETVPSFASEVPTVGSVGSSDVQAQQPRYSSDGALWCVTDTSGWLNVVRNGTPVLPEDYEHAGPTWGAGQRSYAVSPNGRRVALNRNERGFGRLVLVDLDRDTVSEVAKGVHGQLRWVGDRLTALRTGGRTPTQVVAYDMSSSSGPWTRTTLAVGPVAEWSAADEYLVEPELIEVNTYQGSRVPARAYRPSGSGARASGRLICWMHGGPTDQWQVTFMPRITYWVSRGWTVLVPDHRGSTGHGRAYQQSLRGGWGRVDLSDVAATISYAHALGWGVPARTVLMGGSAGGYTALNVLAEHPELVAGAAVVYPVSDPAVLSEATHRFEAHYVDPLTGSSPVVVDGARLTKPVLILHGDADPVVPVAQSIALAGRAAEAGADVELHIVAGEGHGFRQPANQAAEYAHIGAFVDRLLGVD